MQIPSLSRKAAELDCLISNVSKDTKIESSARKNVRDGRNTLSRGKGSRWLGINSHAPGAPIKGGGGGVGGADEEGGAGGGRGG